MFIQTDALCKIFVQCEKCKLKWHQPPSYLNTNFTSLAGHPETAGPSETTRTSKTTRTSETARASKAARAPKTASTEGAVGTTSTGDTFYKL